MEEENRDNSFRLEFRDLDRLIASSIERRERLSAELEDLRAAVKAIEGQARRLEREIVQEGEFIERLRTGDVRVWQSATVHPDEFAHLSIPDAAEKAIRELRQPLHVRKLVELLEAGGKRFNAARPTVSIASALSRDSRFVRVGKNTFDLVERTQPRLPIEE